MLETIVLAGLYLFLLIPMVGFLALILENDKLLFFALRCLRAVLIINTCIFMYIGAFGAASIALFGLFLTLANVLWKK